MERGREWYWSEHGPTLHAAAMEVLRSSTQARRSCDVTDKNNRQKVKAKQSSAMRVMCLNRKHRELTTYASRISGNRASTIHRRRTVNYSHSVQSTVDNWISKVKGSLLMLISTYLFNVSYPGTLNEQACMPIQIYATDIEDSYMTQDPLAIHSLEVDARKLPV